ncbi:thymidylate kinase [archaeon]|jgi:thymidylate kinase|nr:thymidylate kinase [archaeon]MBT3731249.1 thymidylate kinase [archaeon]MBT4669997.1 thymidylate kinase [archaeon]MBT5287801.1 thymidylate kinase [archaeon]MBT7053243.1 thymidylate kinase [archaeon]
MPKHDFPGKLVIVDGLDGIGKGVVMDSIVEYLRAKGMRVFDINEYWQENHEHPEFEHSFIGDKTNPHYIPLSSFDVVVSSEPTYVGIGRAIRSEIISKNNRKYSPLFTAEMYAADRLLWYQRGILPMLKAGKIIIQSRGVITSLVYQSMQAKDTDQYLPMDHIAALHGNKLTLDFAPDLIIIPTIEDVGEIIKRLEGREKDDNAIFESLRFQEMIKPSYESTELRTFFEKHGTKVEYLDAGISIEETIRQAVGLYHKNIER